MRPRRNRPWGMRTGLAPEHARSIAGQTVAVSVHCADVG